MIHFKSLLITFFWYCWNFIKKFFNDANDMVILYLIYLWNFLFFFLSILIVIYTSTFHNFFDVPYFWSMTSLSVVLLNHSINCLLCYLNNFFFFKKKNSANYRKYLIISSFFQCSNFKIYIRYASIQKLTLFTNKLSSMACEIEKLTLFSISFKTEMASAWMNLILFSKPAFWMYGNPTS